MLSRVREQTTKRLLLQAHLLLLVPQRRRRRRRRRRRLSRLSPRRRKLSRRSMDPMAGPRRTTGRFRSRSTTSDGCVQLARALPSLRAAAALVSTVVAHPPLSPPSSFPSAASFVALPPLCNHWRVWTASDAGTYVHRAPLLARALPSLRAAAALVSTVVAHPPLSPPSSFPSAASFVALPPLCNHWRVWTASGSVRTFTARRCSLARCPHSAPPPTAELTPPPSPRDTALLVRPLLCRLRMLLVHGQELDVLLHSQQPNALLIKAGWTYNGTGSQTDDRSYGWMAAAASPPPAPGAAAKTAAKASETAAEPTESAAAEAEPAVDGSDGWAAANHRQVPLKKHDERYVRAARSRAALTPRRRCTRFDRRRSPSSLAPLFFPFRRVLRRAPASLQSLARLDGISWRYVRSPRAAAHSRAALTPRHLPPLSSPLPPLPATPPSSYAPSFAGYDAAGARTRARRIAALPAAQRTTHQSG